VILPAYRGQKNRRSTRKCGAQPGHKSPCRSLLPLKRVDQAVPPSSCRYCGHDLEEAPKVGIRGCHQIVSPGSHSRASTRRSPSSCLNCRHHTHTPVSTELCRRQLGTRLVAFAATLTTHFRLSRRVIAELFHDLLDVPPLHRYHSGVGRWRLCFSVRCLSTM